MNHSATRTKVAAAVVLAGLFPWVVSSAALFLFGKTQHVLVPLHACAEVAGACIALGVSALLFLRLRYDSTSPHLLWVAGALVAMGLVGGAHGLIPGGIGLVWTRHATSVVGGLIFAMVWLRVPAAMLCRRHLFILVVVALAAMVATAIATLSAPQAPTAGHGQAIVFSVVGALGFLAAAVFFIRRYLLRPEVEDMVFASHTLLLGTASLLSSVLHTWAADWWVWHGFRVLAYAIVIIVAHGTVTACYERLQRHAKEALRKSEERYRSLYLDSRDAIMIVSPEHGFLAGNPAAISLFGCRDEQDLMTQTIDSLSPERQPDGARSSDRAREMLALAYEKGSHFFKWQHRRADGPEFTATVLLSRMENGGERLLQATVRDITAQEQAERELEVYRQHIETLVAARTADLQHANERLEQHDRARTEFISNVSHELKTPLASLTFALDNMLQGVVGPIPEGCRAYLDMMRHSCLRLQKTVENILDMARINAKTMRLNRAKVPMSMVVRQTVRALQTQIDAKSQRITFSLPPGAGFVECDRHAIERVIVNVVANAIKFTPQGGEIAITLGSEPALPGMLLLEIVDNGIGIPAEELPRVTERYFRGNQVVDGAGLGLSISKDILELHGGSISLASPPPGKENGTMVSLRLPSAEPPTVFLVGNEKVCALVSLQLMSYGCKAPAYRDGWTAVADMHRETPYAVILDFSTAGMMNTTTIAQIRDDARFQRLPLIALTEADAPDTTREILAALAVPALKYPWHEDDLFSCLERAVVRSRHKGEGR